MPRIQLKTFLRSFSFRAGILIFLVFTTALLTVRFMIYTQSIEIANNDIRLIIDAHVDEINEGVEQYGTKYADDLLEGIIADAHDEHLYIALKQRSGITGNLHIWPEIKSKPKEFKRIVIPETETTPELHLLAKQINYRHNASLIVAYDLQRVELLKDTLLRVMLENLILSLVLSLAISLMIVWLLNRHFRRFNIACQRIMMGQIDYRLHTGSSNDEFDNLAANINSMLDWNKTLIMTVKDSGNAIAHDMRTPLSRLRLELRALSERPKLDAETRKQVLEHVERVDNLIEMFESILNIAKAESRLSTELFEVVDIKQLVQDLLDFYAPILEEKQLYVNIDLPEESLTLKGDKQLLGQAIMNLVDNAYKYTPEKGDIQVSLHKEHGIIKLVIADSGVGLAAELLEKAKDRFFRADASRTTKGHGLGLSLVNAVATLHQGELILEDNDPGLKVTLTLRGDSF